MKRKGIHKPTIEDIIEISGIEMLHPGGHELTRRSAQKAGLQPGSLVLDVSSGRGTPALVYAREFGARVVGLDICADMVQTARAIARRAGLNGQVRFEIGDSQHLPFGDNTFDAVINECAVGIPDDSQQVLNEMVRVAKPGAAIVIHESTWRRALDPAQKDDIAERYGTTPLEMDEWLAMLQAAGLAQITTEFERWSKPEMFWKIRADRDVAGFGDILTWSEKTKTIARILRRFGLRGVLKALANEKKFFQVVSSGALGYCLFQGIKPAAG